MARAKTLNIITGHTGGLGKELTKSLNQNNVIGISRHRDDSLKCKQIEIDIQYLPVSMMDGDNSFLKNSKINLVLCASTLGKHGGILDTNPQDWSKTIETNLIGNLSVLKTMLPQMIKTQYGRVVFLAGGGSAYGYPLFSGYALSKVATVREVENIAIELKDVIDDFSIIALAPGAMETAMLKQVREAGAEIRTTVDIKEPVEFIKNFLNMDKEKAKSLSGRFIHVRDDLESEDFKNKWLLRRIE